jgi:hypothetical protein
LGVTEMLRSDKGGEMLAEITAALTTATSASKLLASLREILKDPKSREEILKIQGIISDLQTKMFDVHAKYAELLASKDEIAAKLKTYESWDATASDYYLYEISPGSFVQCYGPHPSHHSNQPNHYACPNCFEDHKRSVLQGINIAARIYKCPKCDFETQSTAPPGQPQVVIPGLPRRRNR